MGMSRGGPFRGAWRGRSRGSARRKSAGAARLREPVRDEATFQVCDLVSLLEDSHSARLIWAYASKVDLSDPESEVKARGDAGHGADLAAFVVGAMAFGDGARDRQRAGMGASWRERDGLPLAVRGVSVNHRMSRGCPAPRASEPMPGRRRKRPPEPCSSSSSSRSKNTCPSRDALFQPHEIIVMPDLPAFHGDIQAIERNLRRMGEAQG